MIKIEDHLERCILTSELLDKSADVLGEAFISMEELVEAAQIMGSPTLVNKLTKIKNQIFDTHRNIGETQVLLTYGQIDDEKYKQLKNNLDNNKE